MNLKKWKKLPKGGVIEKAGNSVDYETGNWIPKELIWNKKTCINCNLCWVTCPDCCILVDKKGDMKGVDTKHCKDCGLCVQICPTKPKSLYFIEEKPKKI